MHLLFVSQNTFYKHMFHLFTEVNDKRVRTVGQTFVPNLLSNLEVPEMN